MFSTSVLALIAAAATALVSGGPVYKMSPSGSGCGVSTEIKYHVWQIKFLQNCCCVQFCLLHHKVFLPQRTKADSLDGTEAGCTLSNYFKGLVEELPPINQGFS